LNFKKHIIILRAFKKKIVLFAKLAEIDT
jgi:hypothetical protein